MEKAIYFGCILHKQPRKVVFLLHHHTHPFNYRIESNGMTSVASTVSRHHFIALRFRFMYNSPNPYCNNSPKKG